MSRLLVAGSRHVEGETKVECHVCVCMYVHIYIYICISCVCTYVVGLIVEISGPRYSITVSSPDLCLGVAIPDAVCECLRV